MSDLQCVYFRNNPKLSEKNIAKRPPYRPTLGRQIRANKGAHGFLACFLCKILTTGYRVLDGETLGLVIHK